MTNLTREVTPALVPQEVSTTTTTPSPATTRPTTSTTTTRPTTSTTTTPPLPPNTTLPPTTTTTLPTSSSGAVQDQSLVDASGRTQSNLTFDPWAVPVNYVPPARTLADGSTYTGNNRVNAKGEFDYVFNPTTGKTVAQTTYNSQTDTSEILYNMDYPERKKIFTKLYEHNLYSGEKPSAAFNDPNREGQVVTRVSNIANRLGVTWDVAYNWVLINLPFTGSGRSVKVSSATDIGESATTQSQDILGVGVNKKRKAQIVAGVQAGERGAAGRGEDMASVSSAVRQNIRQASPQQAKAFSFAKYAQMLQQMMAQQ